MHTPCLYLQIISTSLCARTFSFTFDSECHNTISSSSNPSMWVPVQSESSRTSPFQPPRGCFLDYCRRPRVCVHASPNPSILNQALRAIAGRLPLPFHHSQVPVFHAGESHPCASILLRLPPLNFSHRKYDVGWLCMLMVADQPH